MLSFLISLLFCQTTIYVIIIFSLLYYWATKNNDFFEKRGIVYLKPVPFFGNLWSIMSHQKNFWEHYLSIYNQFKDVGMFGSFEFTRPILMIRDPDLVKQICIKDFDSFVNHRVSIDQDVDPIFGGNLFVIKDAKWKLMRNIMSPAFTGTKMRFLFSSIRDSLCNTTDYLVNEAKKTNGIYEFEARDLFTRCSVDVIASAAFGIEVNSIKDKTNEFYDKGYKMADFTKFSRTMRFFVYLTWPKLGAFLRLKILEDEYTSFFKTCLLDVMQERQVNKTSRPDFVQILLQAKTKGKIEVEKGEENEYFVGNEPLKHDWSDNDFVAQSVIFFLAGFETATTLFNYMAYELAINEDIQERLLQEIDDVLEQLGDKPIDYETIMQMKYLDMVIQESLRKHPPNIGVDRVANKPYTLEDKTGQKIQLQSGDAVFLSTVGFHHDTRFWENPSKFDPERFNDENKHKIDQGVFMPFGIGPRQCIGNRFALMEAKILFFTFLSKFKLVAYEKTPIPLEYKKGTFGTYAKNGIWLHFKTRK
ncbi:probable cytochrome P450 9f2 [Culicoides brevitarsis]|uniref:probable cytochrome P450 9f2 n=1 Tax=Culicoides brevitarsis TaxID=469753 RepID=UPI00307C3AC8